MSYPYMNPNQAYQEIYGFRNINPNLNQPQQVPVQNIINTNGNMPEIEMEARFLKDGEDVTNIIIKYRTAFIDEKNRKLSIKEIDGSISRVYELIPPKDEKDLKIDFLENKLKEMEAIIYGLTNNVNAVEKCEQSNGSDSSDTKSSTKRISK